MPLAMSRVHYTLVSDSIGVRVVAELPALLRRTGMDWYVDLGTVRSSTRWGTHSPRRRGTSIVVFNMFRRGKQAVIETVAVGDRYTIDRELGRGGMAVVYLARDRKHDRPVAIKILRPEIVAGKAAQRFLREIRIQARLQHPHILPLLDSGTTDEASPRPFYVMPYVDGETLRQRLTREGPLPVAEALRLVRESGEALHYAHGEGLIHRDVKPENVLLSQGHALVADFGIARAADVAADDRLTRPGLSMGTPTYMSPEQAQGESGVDARADQYSLACVLYELLAGQPPFTGAERARGVVAPGIRPGAATHHAPPRRAGVGATGHRAGTIQGPGGPVCDGAGIPGGAGSPGGVPRPRRRRQSWYCRSPI